MPDTGWELAQVNIALPVAPLESEQLADFVAALDPINAIADDSPGFIWRLQTDAGDATGINGFGDDRLIVNLSVWQSLEALGDFVFRSGHVEVMRRRREWFERLATAYTALWWVPRGHRPSIAEAEDRLETLRRNGSTARAFTFREPHPPPDSTANIEPATEHWLCPA
jgi:Domain of unknown function (DUF3291)